MNEDWLKYKETNDLKLREKLILHYYPVVKRVAIQLKAGYPDSVMLSDLESYGLFGLIDAVEKFDPEVGVKFETYASPRIKGSILDELRRDDWVPRSIRSKAKEIDRAQMSLESSLKRMPTEQEVADKADMSLDKYRSVQRQVYNSNMAALDSPSNSTATEWLGEVNTLKDTIPDEKLDDPFQFEDVVDKIVQSIEDMNEKERIVVTLFYYEKRSLVDIGTILGVTESRVCQILTKAVLRGKDALSLIV